jgi:hypothetical protein
MTQEDIIRLALAAGFEEPIEGWMGPAYVERLERFAALAALVQEPVQEPVAWQVMVEDEAMNEFSIKDIAHDWCIQQKRVGSPYSYWIRPLYTAPPAAHRQPLTEEQIRELWDGRVVPVFGKIGINPIVFARALEAAHKIGGEA